MSKVHITRRHLLLLKLAQSNNSDVVAVPRAWNRRDDSVIQPPSIRKARSLGRILGLKNSGSLEYTPKSNFPRYKAQPAKAIKASLNNQLDKIRESISKSQKTLDAAIYHVEKKQSWSNKRGKKQKTLDSYSTRLLSNNLHFSWALSQLGGWDMCAVVSAVVTMISIYFYDHRSRTNPWARTTTNTGNKHKDQWYMELTMELLSEGLNYAGIVTGLFGTMVFSLLSIYGRQTLARQQSLHLFDEFVHHTLHYQTQAASSFRMSLDLLGVQTILFFQSQMESPSLQWAGVAILGFTFWKRLREVQASLALMDVKMDGGSNCKRGGI